MIDMLSLEYRVFETASGIAGRSARYQPQSFSFLTSTEGG